MSKQETLFQIPNPMIARLGKEFFATMTREPGVYLMRSLSGQILYVGKAKNLRNRLNSYKNARPNIVSRKVMRMLRLTHAVETQVCGSETLALLTENQLLRLHRPPFNVVNTHPDSYYFIFLKVLRRDDTSLQLRFTLTADAGEKKGRCFGVFKGRGLTRDAFGALLRLVSALNATAEGFYFPGALVRYRVPRIYEQALPQDLLTPLYAFLHGRSRVFLNTVVERLLSNELVPRFIHHVITEDLKLLEEFYERGPRRVRRLKRLNGIRRRVIGQDEIDDLLVLARPDAT